MSSLRRKLIKGRGEAEKGFAKIMTDAEKIYALAVFIKETARFEGKRGKRGGQGHQPTRRRSNKRGTGRMSS